MILMRIKENLELYQELIKCSHNVYYWIYSPELTLLHTSCPKELADGNNYFLLSQSVPLLNHAKNGHYPFIMDTFLNLLWIADFEWEGEKLNRIHIIGPTFSGRTSYQKVKESLDRHNLSVKIRMDVMKQLEGVPILPTNLLFQYAIMLHYCITGEKIAIHDLEFITSLEEHEDTEEISLTSDEHRGIWAAEQTLLQMIREGNPNYKEALGASSTLSNGVKFDSGDTLRNARNNLIVLLTLCSRAAVEGGLSPSVSYTMQDYYTQRVEDSGSIPDISILAETILEDYVQRVRQARTNDSISKSVQNCCNYIQANIGGNLSIWHLAVRAGYTEYYFSRKFKQEMKCSISEYVKQEKIRRAKLLLSSTNMSIIDISNELGFNSRSYFSDTFQKITGESPGEYRGKNLKI